MPGGAPSRGRDSSGAPGYRRDNPCDAGSKAAVTDDFGNEVGELRAPASGVVLMLRDTPPIDRGQSVVTPGIR